MTDIWIATGARDRIFSEGRLCHPLETGGVLLGWRDGLRRIVVDVIGPGPRALYGRHMFIPDHRWQWDRIEEAFARSGGDLDYLGDWHTHPAGVAKMSGMDDRTLRRLTRRVKGALMVIAAGRDEDWVLGAWSMSSAGFLKAGQPQARAVRVFDAPSDWPRADAG